MSLRAGDRKLKTVLIWGNSRLIIKSCQIQEEKKKRPKKWGPEKKEKKSTTNLYKANTAGARRKGEQKKNRVRRIWLKGKGLSTSQGTSEKNTRGEKKRGGIW